MPINQKNLDILDEIEKELHNASFQFIEKTFNASSDTIKEYRSLQITILGLSVTIAGVVIPLLISKDINNFFIRDIFFVSIILFALNIIFGIISHSVMLSNERKYLWKNADVKMEEISKLTEEVRKIRKIDDNNEAGLVWIELRKKVVNQIEKNKIVKNTDWVEVIFFGLFISAILSTFLGILKILYS